MIDSVHNLTINGNSFTYLRNEHHAKVISTDISRFAVRVIHTDEELMIARSMCHLLGFDADTPIMKTPKLNMKKYRDTYSGIVSQD